jgi:hypothetical protein
MFNIGKERLDIFLFYFSCGLAVLNFVLFCSYSREFFLKKKEFEEKYKSRVAKNKIGKKRKRSEIAILCII